MSKMIFLLLMTNFLNAASIATLYLIDGRVIKGKVVSTKHVVDRERYTFNFMKREKTSNSTPMTIYKPSLDSVVLLDTTLHFVKGSLVEDIKDTSICIFDLEKDKWKKGVYRTYAELYYNSPVQMDNLILQNATINARPKKNKDREERDVLYVSRTRTLNIQNVYSLIDTISLKEFKLPNDYWGYCDGHSIYYSYDGYLCKVIYDEQFLFSGFLNKTIEGLISAHMTVPLNAPQTIMISTPVGNTHLNIGGSFVGGSGGSIEVWEYEPLVFDRKDGIAQSVYSFQSYRFNEIIANQPPLQKEYKAIPEKVIKENPSMQYTFLLRYLDLIDHQWFAWYKVQKELLPKDFVLQKEQ